ncbi:hypothetical protein BH10PLA2_BH10PLA2_05390 [soil metagenome]
MTRSLLVPFFSIAVLTASATPLHAMTDMIEPRQKIVHYEPSDLRTRQGVTALRRQIHFAIKEVCAVYDGGQYLSSATSACRRLTELKVRPRVSQAIAMAADNQRVALAPQMILLVAN